MSSFEWKKMYKVEEHLEREAFACVEHKLCDTFNVESVDELTKEQIDVVMDWRENNVNEYSMMYGAFQDVYNYWEMNNEQET